MAIFKNENNAAKVDVDGKVDVEAGPKNTAIADNGSQVIAGNGDTITVQSPDKSAEIQSKLAVIQSMEKRELEEFERRNSGILADTGYGIKERNSIVAKYEEMRKKLLEL